MMVMPPAMEESKKQIQQPQEEEKLDALVID